MKKSKGFIELGLIAFYFVIGVTVANASAGKLGKSAAAEPVQVAQTK